MLTKRAKIFAENWKERDWKYPLVVGENGYVGSVAMFAGSGSSGGFDETRMDKDNTVNFPLAGLVRNTLGRPEQQFWWLGKLSNGSYIAPGKYK